MDKKTVRRIRLLQHFFYIVFIVFWFKDNFAPLRNVPVHYLFALVPWLGLTFWRLSPRIRRFRFSLPRKISKETATLLALILLTILLRLPYLASSSGLMTSDDAVPALMGKHIAEGKTPALCYYGQLYMGSLSSHFYGLAFRLFGYSMLVLKCATLLIYLTFMIVQFYFLKEVFSFSMALAVGFFYTLPINPLVHAGLDNTSAFALVLLLGSLLLYLAHLVGFRSRDQFLPALGLTMGLAFWTHQITAAFILASLLIVAAKVGWNIRKYAILAYWAFLGFLPQFLVEVFFGFRLVPFLMHGERVANGNSLRAALGFTGDLLTPSRHPARYAFLALVLTGFIAILARAWKSRSSRPQTVFCLFSFLFYVLYTLSHFSNAGVIRYLYPLYVAIPVLLLAGFHFLKPKPRAISFLALIIVLFLALNMKDSLGLMKTAGERHRRIARVISAMEDTGRRYWMAEYWTAFLLTAVSGERLIVDSSTFQRYLPYGLSYWNSPEKDNYIFLFVDGPVERADYNRFLRWREMMGFRFEARDVGKCRLVYDIEPRIYPRILHKDPPPEIPRLELERVEPEGGYLQLVFRNITPGTVGLRFWLTVEVPGYSDRKGFFSLNQPEIRVTIPHPDQDSFAIRHSTDYMGIKIPSSERELWYALPTHAARGRTDPVVFLKGIGPEVPPQKRKRWTCDYLSSFEIQSSAVQRSRLRIILDSPFEFRRWLWYGKYTQTVDIEVNGRFLAEQGLRDGRNIVDVPVPSDILEPGANIVRLKFRYQRWFSSRPLWPIAALLRKVELVD
ncbi:MAG: hypothetical protein WBC70_18445 [Candidatus Aminicenantales bacterium]